MSRKYKSAEEVPTDVLIARLMELSSAIGSGKSTRDREFTMRIPAEVDRDADLVMSEAARRLKSLTAAQEAAISEIDDKLKELNSG